MPTTFTARISILDGRLKLKLNDRNFLVDNGTRSIQLVTGQTYVVQWFVRGAPGATYTVNITAPRSAAGSITRVLNESGIDYGGFRFTAE